MVAGFGPGSRELQANLLGAPYSSPLALAREYVGAVRGLLDGDVVDADGEQLRLRAQLAPAAAPEVEVGLGVLRPAVMARLAGEVADAAITWLTPPDYLREVLVLALARGRRGDRPATPAPGRDGAGRARPLRRRAGGPRARVPTPRTSTLPTTATCSAGPGLDTEAADTAALARQVIDARGFVTGDLDSVHKHLTEYAEAGVDEVVLNAVMGVHRVCGGSAALQDLQQILGAA